MSALPPEADVDQSIADVRFVPEADIGPARSNKSDKGQKADICPAATRTAL